MNLTVGYIHPERILKNPVTYRAAGVDI